MLCQEGMNLNIQKFKLGLEFQPQAHSLGFQLREMSSQIFCFLEAKFPKVVYVSYSINSNFFKNDKFFFHFLRTNRKDNPISILDIIIPLKE